MIEDIINRYPDEEFLKADGLDDAIIGVDTDNMVLVYSSDQCVDCFIEQGMSREEAIEFFEFNTKGAHMGEKTPIFISTEF